MKNRRWITLGMCGLMTWFFVMPAVGATPSGRTYAPKGATMKLQIERKTMTKDSAEIYRANNKKINLGVYVIFSKEWASVMEGEDANVSFYTSQVAWAFYENESFCSTGGTQTASQLNSLDPTHYLQNPSDYIAICAASTTPGKPADGCTLPNVKPADWYAGPFVWDNWGWPTYAWGGSFTGDVINVAATYTEKLTDGSYKVKLYDIQFKLTNAPGTNFRDLPVGFLDDISGSQQIDVSTSNCQLNPVKGSNRYWPTSDGTTYESCPSTSALCQDWTDMKGTKYFEFIPGGLFIETGPEVVTFSPNSVA